MTRRLRDQGGFALLGSMMILVILMGLGLALIARSDTQSISSGQERVRESRFNLAEAALNAQALQLGRSWPTGNTSDCDAGTGAQSYCPLGAAIGNGYTTQDYAGSCPSTGNTAALWKTQIRDNGPGTNPQYWTTAVNSQPHYDANADGNVWVRAFSTVQCQAGSVVGLVSQTSQPITIANTVLTANYMTTTNQGKKVIIDTLGAYAQPPSIQPGPASQPSKIVLRCSSAPSPCANYTSSKGQIQPPTVTTSTTTSPQALTATQLQALESQAAAAGTLHTGTDCPNSTSTLSSPSNGAPVVIQGPCNISATATGSINTGTKPGVLVIENGTFTLGGTVSFYGLLYMVNKQASSGIVVSITGNATLQGSVNIDGNGGISVGGSKTNLIFDSRAAGLLKGSTGAAVNRGSVRTLPASTP